MCFHCWSAGSCVTQWLKQAVHVLDTWGLGAGTPMQDNKPPSAVDIVRCVATARVTMPRSVVRLSAGRLNFSLTDQVSCARISPPRRLHLV